MMSMEYVVNENRNLRSILRDELKISSRLFSKIKDDYVWVNGEHPIYYKELNEGDVIRIYFDYPDWNFNNIVPNDNIKLDILYEDKWLLIVNKSANLPVHPSINYYTNSLSNGVRAYFGKLGLYKTVSLVNRIDKDTTGIVIIAKCEYIQEYLIREMKTNDFLKEYIAIVKRKS